MSSCQRSSTESIRLVATRSTRSGSRDGPRRARLPGRVRLVYPVDRAAAGAGGLGARGLQPIGLHECCHTFASLMIAAGVNAKARSTFMGHASVTITYDRYGHLMPDGVAEGGELLAARLSRG
jgi:integrase